MSEADDFVAISRLWAAYADGISRRAWTDVQALFVPDAPVVLDLRGRELEFTGAVDLTAFIAASMEQFDFFLFVVLNGVADIDGDAATGRMLMSEVRQKADVGRRTDTFGLYEDRYRRTPDGWRFAARRYSSLARTNASGEGPDVDWLGFPDLQA